MTWESAVGTVQSVSSDPPRPTMLMKVRQLLSYLGELSSRLRNRSVSCSLPRLHWRSALSRERYLPVTPEAIMMLSCSDQSGEMGKLGARTACDHLARRIADRKTISDGIGSNIEWRRRGGRW